MKTHFRNEVGTRSGTDRSEGITYMAVKNRSISVMRRYTKPTIKEHNRALGAKFRVASGLYRFVNKEFKEALGEYARAFNAQLLEENKLPLNHYNIFIKAVCRHPVGLGSIEEIIEVMGNTVQEWMARGYLEKVKMKKEISGQLTVDR